MSAPRGHALSIEVDGGIGPGTAEEVVRAGADLLVAGSAIFGAPPYADAITALRAGAARGRA